MTKGEQEQTASIVQTLVFYRGPQLILLRSDRDRNVCAIAVTNPDFRQAYFAAEIRDNIVQRYFDGKADLNYAMRNSVADRYYIFDLTDVTDNTVVLRPFSKEIAQQNEYFPDPGMFSRTHTTQYNIRTIPGTVSHVFKIDGNWEARDISYFHTKITNLYALFSSLNKLDGGDADEEREFVRNLIQERFWRGGGSYVGFYDDLYDHIRIANPLAVESIQYNSPGQIVFRGDSTVFAEIHQIVDVFENNYGDLKDTYGVLYGALAKERLLRARPGSRFSSETVAEYVLRETRSLAQAMRLEKIDDLFQACDGNVQVFCKVVLSIYRRAHELYTFHAEGRVQIKE